MFKNGIHYPCRRDSQRKHVIQDPFHGLARSYCRMVQHSRLLYEVLRKHRSSMRRDASEVLRLAASDAARAAGLLRISIDNTNGTTYEAAALYRGVRTIIRQINEGVL